MIIEEMLYNTIRGSNAQMGVVKKPALGTGVGGGGNQRPSKPCRYKTADLYAEQPISIMFLRSQQIFVGSQYAVCILWTEPTKHLSHSG